MPSGLGLNAFEDIRPAVVTVTAFKRPWALVGRSAFDWLGAAAVDLDHLSGVFPGLASMDDLDHLWSLTVHGDFDKRCVLAARAAYAKASGKDWWWALNLTRKALTGWPVVNGVLIRQGVRAKEVELADWMDALYSLMWQNASEEDRMKLDIELAMLPAGVRVKQSSAAKKAMLAAFAAD